MPRRRPNKSHPKYPLADLRVGQSFFIDRRIDLTYWRKKFRERRFEMRSEEGGWRIWRVA